MCGMFRNILNFFVDIYHYVVNKITDRSQQPQPIHSDEKKIESVQYDEKTPPKKVARRVTPFHKNVTAALELPISTDKLTELHNDPNTLFHMCKDFIREHSARRMDLYFYLLIAVYKTQYQLHQENTMLQHGKGRKSKSPNRISLTHACHSNFFPNLIATKNNVSAAPNENMFDRTHFMDTMNITCELPIFVNQLDSMLEGKIHYPSHLRKKSLNILQLVSRGTINPVEGYRQFLSTFNSTLQFFGNEQNNKKIHYLGKKSGPNKSLKLELINTVKSGICCENDDKFDDFIHLHLRLNANEISDCQKNLKLKQKIYEEKFTVLQKEIFEYKSQLKSRKKN